MKDLLLISLIIIASTGCQTIPQKGVSFAGVHTDITAPSSLEFRGDVYRAGYSGVPPHRAIVEYYLTGEGPKSWHKMLALRLDSTGKGSLDQVKAVQGSRAVRAYNSVDGHGVEFILSMRGRQELNVFRYVDRTNGTVSLQYAEIIPHSQMDGMDDAKVQNFLVTARSNAVWGLEAMSIPQIVKAQ
jgi:hypothetical protein